MHVQQVHDLSVKFEDVFHLKNLYKMMREWLKENGYTDPERGGLEASEGGFKSGREPGVYVGGEPENYMEAFYLERISQQSGREVWVWWRTKREMSSYVHRQLNINMHVLNMKDVEVMVKGHKFKSQKGEVEVILSASLITDPNKEWENSKMMGRLVEFFRKRVFKEEWEKAVEDFARDTYRLQEDIKKYLQLQTTSPTEIFHPERGI